MVAKEWEQLELLVAKIQQELAPHAEVLHNAKIMGRATDQQRQVDVLVRQKIGQYEMVIAIDCKDYSSPVDVKGVEEFKGLIDDIGAHKGAMVCPKGFSKTAKKRAKKWQIELYRPVDTDPHKWQVKLALPVICDFRSVSIAFSLSESNPKPFRMPLDFYQQLQVFDHQVKPLGTPLEMALNRWNRGQFPTSPGEHHNVAIFSEPVTMVDNGYGELVPVTLQVLLHVTQRIFFGYLPIMKMRGFRDELTGEVVTNAFTTGNLDAKEVENSWKRLDSGDEPPARPAMVVVGLDCYEIGSGAA